VGNRVILVDGKGGWYEASILDDHPKRCLLKIDSHTSDYMPLPYHLHLAISPTKNMDRFEWFLEKSTEIGISTITPLLCHRTERRNLKPERLEKVLISAMKQSLKAYKPTLNDPIELQDFLAIKHPGTRGIAHCLPNERKGVNELIRADHFTLMVGPEGDFTEEEIGDALKAGFIPFHLGESRLRTETAGVYITAAVQLLPHM
jgi:16S rRNA (uracil1498-N3)-methyltransferase